VPDNPYGGKGRLFQLRQLRMDAPQLKQKTVENHDKKRPYIKN
jgi:hypothetical protein